MSEPKKLEPTQQKKLEIIDIIDAFKIIEYSINSGFFKAHELMQILPVYQKLKDFLDNYEGDQNETCREE